MTDLDPAEELELRLARLKYALVHPFSVNPHSLEGNKGYKDAYWAAKMYFIAFARYYPEQAGTCFFHTVLSVMGLVALLVAVHIL
jgi:hypothetical protein